MSGTLTDLTLRGTTNIVGTLNVPAQSITDSDILEGADIATSKTRHRYALEYHQADGADVADATIPMHIARGTTGVIVAIEVAVATAITGDSTVTVDLQQGNSSSAFATVLTSVVTIDSSLAVRTPLAGTLDTTSFVDGDLLQLVVNATAGTGTLPQGLFVTVWIDETPN